MHLVFFLWPFGVDGPTTNATWSSSFGHLAWMVLLQMQNKLTCPMSRLVSEYQHLIFESSTESIHGNATSKRKSVKLGLHACKPMKWPKCYQLRNGKFTHSSFKNTCPSDLLPSRVPQKMLPVENAELQPEIGGHGLSETTPNFNQCHTEPTKKLTFFIFK